MGVAERERHDLAEACRWFRRSASIAARAGLREREGEARLGLGLTLVMQGRAAAGLREVDKAASVAPAAHVLLQRALINTRLGRFADALADYKRGLASVRRAGDRESEARALNNRALLLCWQGDHAGASRDLERAAALRRELGHPMAVAVAMHNLGWVAGRKGDVPAALSAFDAAEAELSALGLDADEVLLDRAELLLSVRLVDEAVAVAERAEVELAAKRMAADRAEARLLLSHGLLAAGRFSEAGAAARAARAAFERDGRPGWAALARYAELRSRVAMADKPTGALLVAAQEGAAALEAAGWAVPAADARLTAGRVALALGRADEAEEELSRARAAARRGPAELRVRAWHADALLKWSAGDGAGAARSLRSGFRVLDEHRAALGATELRAHVSEHGDELAALGIGMALAEGSAAGVLTWAERHRANALRPRPARPPADAELLRTLAALRAVVSDLNEAALAGEDTGPLLRRQAGLERAARDRLRALPGVRSAEGSESFAAVAAAVGAGTLVEYVEHEARLYAVVVSGGRAALHPLGETAPVAAEASALGFALRRLVRPGLPEAVRASAERALAEAAGRLDELVLAPLAVGAARDGVVVVPTGVLHGVAWSALPSLAAAAFTVAPSATIWTRAQGRAAKRGVAVVAGPGLPGAEREIALVGRSHEGATVVPAPSATAAAVLAALDGAGVAHIAAHGRFRSDNPLFSALELADGPLMVHDLDQLRRAPDMVVLSACDVASSAHAAGDELLGLMAALFGLGTRTVVASAVPVPDEATPALMDRFHAGLGAGAAVALRDARLAAAPGLEAAAAAAFTVYGV